MAAGGQEGTPHSNCQKAERGPEATEPGCQAASSHGSQSSTLVSSSAGPHRTVSQQRGQQGGLQGRLPLGWREAGAGGTPGLQRPQLSLPAVSLPGFPCVGVTPSLSISPLTPFSPLPASLSVSLTPCAACHHLSPPIFGEQGRTSSVTKESGFAQNVFRLVPLPVMNKYVLPKGPQINTNPLCRVPEVNYCFMTNVPGEENTLSKTAPCLSPPVSK